MTDPSPIPEAQAVNDQPQTQTLLEDEIDDLVYFARTGDIDELASSLKEVSSRTGLSSADVLLNAKDEDGHTPLHMAVGNGHLATTTLLIAHISSHPSKLTILNAQNSFGNTPLHWAAERGHTDIVKFLISSGADVAIVNSNGDIPLDSAQFGMREEVTAYFISQNERLEKDRKTDDEGEEEKLAKAMGDVGLDKVTGTGTGKEDGVENANVEEGKV